MKSALGLMTLLIVGASELSVRQSAIAQALPRQTSEAADLIGTQERAVSSDGLPLPSDGLNSNDLNSDGLNSEESDVAEGSAVVSSPLMPLTLESLRTDEPIDTSDRAANRAANTAPESSSLEKRPSVSTSPDGSVPATDEFSETLKLELRLSQRQLLVYRGEMLIANYPVAVGREGWQTPTGEFSVFQKQVEPTWEHPFTGELVPPGPNNPLGSRWIGFWSDGQNSIGFHGTPDESVIGSAVSHGCVRMRNEDVQSLYEQVSLNTTVIVLP